jgi:hypothetical protein
MGEMIVLSFLSGAFVMRMYYRSILKRVEAERDSWENKALEAQKQKYKDLFNEATNRLSEYE